MIAPVMRRVTAMPAPVTTSQRMTVAGRRVEIRTACTADLAASVAGCRLAERLAADLLGVSPATLRVATLPPTGRPVVLHGGQPAACGISISHTVRPAVAGAFPGLVAVAACRDGRVGIDIVTPADVRPEPLACFLSAADSRPADDPRHVALEWAAREAAYKASAVDEPFRPRRVVVTRPAADLFCWRVAGRFRVVHGVGRFFVVDDRLGAVAVADRGFPPQPGASAPS